MANMANLANIRNLLFEEMPFWRRVWQTVCGSCETARPNDVTELLTTVRERLVQGLMIFRIYSGETRQWRNIIGEREELGRIIKRLAIATDVDMVVTWSLFCNYLTFVYHGKMEDIHQVARYELRLMNLVEQYQHFYSMERMYMLKTIHHILNHFDNANNRFQSCYEQFINHVSVYKIRQSLLNQFHVLHVAILQNRFNMEQIPTIRCVTELRQICIMLATSAWGRGRHIFLGSGEVGTEMEPLMQQFVHVVHGAAHRKYGLLTQVRDVIGESALLDLHYAHIAAVLLPLSDLWNNYTLWKNHRIELARVFLDNRYTSVNDYRVIFTLHWALIVLISPTDYDRDVQFDQIFRAHVADSLQRGALRMLATFCNSTLIRDLFEGHRIRSAVYRLFQQVYVSIDADDGLYKMPGLVPLLTSLMKDMQIGYAIMSGDNEVGVLPMLKINRIFSTVEELFPFDFISFSNGIHAMMRQVSYEQLALQKLNDLCSFAEERYELSVVLLLSDYAPFNNNIVIAPAEQEAKQVQRRLRDVHIYATRTYNYFEILHCLMQRYLTKAEERTGHIITTDNYATALISGLRLMVDVLEHHISYRSNRSFKRCMNLVFPLIVNNFETMTYDHDLVISCLQVCVKMMAVMPEKVMKFLKGMKVFPAIHTDYYASEEFMSLRNLHICPRLLSIVDHDSMDDKGEVVDLFIEMIQLAINANEHYRTIQLPFSVYLFQKLFTTFQLSTYEYSQSRARVKTITKIVELLHQILVQEPLNESAQKLRSQCLELVLSKASFIESFLHTVVRNTNIILEFAVSQQSNWDNLQTIGVMRLAKLCISILLLLIQTAGGSVPFIQRPFGMALVHTQPEALNSIKILVTLINNSFDAKLREATCRLFSKLAQNPFISLLGHLDMDSYQVRGMFLDKLRDQLEENTMKVAIVDFIATSVVTQNALTAAFFNFLNYGGGNDLDLNDNVFSFIREHLENIKNFSDLWTSPIQQAVINLLMQIWCRGIEIITMPLTNMRDFWRNLACPLFAELKPPNINYANIANVFVMQLRVSSTTGQLNPQECETVLNEMFTPKKDNFILSLLRYVRESLRDSIENDKVLLGATRNLLTMIPLHRANLFYNNETISEIAFSCLEGLWDYMKNPRDNACIEMWMTTYLHVMCLWGIDGYTDYETDTLFLLSDIINMFSIRYNSMSLHSKLTLLTICTNVIVHLKDWINEDPKLLWPFLRAMRKIMDIEEKSFHVEYQETSCTDNWTMLIIFISNIFDLPCAATYKMWFCDGIFFQLLMTTASRYMAYSKTLPIAKLALQTLVKYVVADMYVTVSQSDLESFYRKGYPPEHFLEFRSYETKLYRETPFEAFWSTYLVLVQYNTALLRNRPCENFEAGLAFYRIHWQVIETLMKLPCLTVQSAALTLVQGILDFGCEMLEQKEEWHRSEMGPKMIADFFAMVRLCMNSCIQIMLAPNIIQFFTQNTTCPLNVEQVSYDIYVEIFEQILGLITTACNCHNKVTPSQIGLMASETTRKRLIDSNVIDPNFSIPKISSNLNTKLSYGDLLFLHQILVQILYKVHNQQRAVQLDEPDDEIDFESTIKLRQKISKERRLLFQIKNLIDGTQQKGDVRSVLLALVCPDYVQRGITDWTTRRMPEPDICGMSAPWLNRLSEGLTLCTMEALTTLLGREIHIQLGTYRLNSNSTELQYYRRHFITELQAFHDYVRKWRCGNIPLGVVLSGITYHRSTQMAAAASDNITHAHSSLVSPRMPLSQPPSEIFSVDSAMPNIFTEWQGSKQSQLDRFFAPTQTGGSASDKTIQNNHYLLMLSHWLDYVCNTND